MFSNESFDYDDLGKINLYDIYDKPDPRSYYSTLRRLKYIIPETAKPIFQEAIAAYRSRRQKSHVRILDVGCSYGINAAMLKGDLEMAKLYDHYDPEITAQAVRRELVERDQSHLEEMVKDPRLEVVGLDASLNAINYAVEANLLDDGVAVDLECGKPSPAIAAVIDDADMVISTGCVGYVGESTFENILQINAPNRPWMVNFVLRMFPFAGIDRMLSRFDYVTEKVEAHTFLQRRFASCAERSHVLERLDELGISSTGLESEGWYHAEAFISCPDGEHGALNSILARC